MEETLPGFDRITVDPAKLGGKPCIRGYRFSVEHLLELLAADWTLDEIRADFPFIEPDDVRQVLRYAATLAHREMNMARADSATGRTWPGRYSRRGRWRGQTWLGGWAFGRLDGGCLQPTGGGCYQVFDFGRGAVGEVSWVAAFDVPGVQGSEVINAEERGVFNAFSGGEVCVEAGSPGGKAVGGEDLGDAEAPRGLR